MQRFLNTTPFTQIFLKCKHFGTKKLLDTKTFLHKRFYIQNLLNTKAFLQKKNFTHKIFYIKKLLYTAFFTYKAFYTQSNLISYEKIRPNRVFSHEIKKKIKTKYKNKKM
jgi:hypothetical protein